MGKGPSLLGSKSSGKLSSVQKKVKERSVTGVVQALPMSLSSENSPVGMETRAISNSTAVSVGEVEIATDGLEVIRSLLVTLSYCIGRLADEERAEKDREEAAKSRHSRQRDVSVLFNKDPSSSSPSMINLGRGSGMHKVSSMPHMGNGAHKGGNVRYGGGALSHLKRTKREEDEDDSDNGIEEGDEEEVS